VFAALGFKVLINDFNLPIKADSAALWCRPTGTNNHVLVVTFTQPKTVNALRVTHSFLDC
jgi:hypothetical protein